MYVKKIMLRILRHVIVKIKKYLASIMDNSTITCDETIESYDGDADSDAKSNDEAKLYDKTKTIPTNFN